MTRDADRLFVRATGQDRLRIYPESETEFFYRAVDARITFRRGPKGEAAGLVLHQDGRDQKAKKVR